MLGILLLARALRGLQPNCSPFRGRYGSFQKLGGSISGFVYVGSCYHLKCPPETVPSHVHVGAQKTTSTSGSCFLVLSPIEGIKTMVCRILAFVESFGALLGSQFETPPPREAGEH